MHENGGLPSLPSSLSQPDMPLNASVSVMSAQIEPVNTRSRNSRQATGTGSCRWILGVSHTKGCLSLFLYTNLQWVVPLSFLCVCPVRCGGWVYCEHCITEHQLSNLCISAHHLNTFGVYPSKLIPVMRLVTFLSSLGSTPKLVNPGYETSHSSQLPGEHIQAS